MKQISSKDFTQITATLCETLTAIRENERDQTSSNYSLEQTLLMPTIMLASACDPWLWSSTDVGGFGHEIQSLLNKLGSKPAGRMAGLMAVGLAASS